MDFCLTMILRSALTPELTGRETSMSSLQVLRMKCKLIPLRLNELLDRPRIVHQLCILFSELHHPRLDALFREAFLTSA